MSGYRKELVETHSAKIDPSKEDVYIKYIYPGIPNIGKIIPLVYISRVGDKYMQGLDLLFGALTQEDISDMVVEGSIMALEQEVKLTPGRGVWAYRGVYNPSVPNEIRVHVILASKENPVKDNAKVLLASYTISEHIDIRKK